ncbi:MAG: excinuclease ABC subunit A, partial [Pseudomonadota bacterium]
MPMLKNIEVRGAREHNLKDVDIDMPRDKLVVITGLSGSGKSSLAFDTIYAEGQRRYVESLSAYARQFLELQGKPDVDSIEGLSPAISIEQKTTSKNPRSTVGTVTEIYDYMRLLWARVGVPYSPATGLPIESQTVSQMVDLIMAMPEGTKLYLLAPVVRNRKGEFRKEIAEWMKAGYQRAKINGEIVRLEEAPELDKKFKQDIDVVVDRVVVREGVETRLADSLEQALQLADGLAVAEQADNPDQRLLFSEKFACPVSGFTLAEIEPRLFSFNSPQGACPSCDGLGQELKFDPDLIIPDDSRSLAGGAIAPWSKTPSSLYGQTLKALADHYGFSTSTPFRELNSKSQDVILYGTKGTAIQFEYKDGKRTYKTKKPFEGVLPNLERRYRETESTWVREELGKYMSNSVCTACNGKRLKPEALSVRVGGMDIAEPGEMSIAKALEHFESLKTTLSAKDMEIAERILKEITDRLKFLNAVGLDYLTLGRGSGSLSGGESLFEAVGEAR